MLGSWLLKVVIYLGFYSLKKKAKCNKFLLVKWKTSNYNRKLVTPTSQKGTGI